MQRFVRRLFARPIFRSFEGQRTTSKRRQLKINVLEDRCTPALFIVNAISDDTTGLAGDTTTMKGDLRFCLTQANDEVAFPGEDTIQFDSTVFSNTQTIKLGAAAPLNITSAIQLLGKASGSKAPIVDGDNATNLMVIQTGDNSVPITISDMTWTKGKLTTATDIGAGFGINKADLTLTNVTISDCFARSSGAGIAMLSGKLTATNVSVINNKIDALQTSFGAGIYLYGPGGETSASFKNCTISNNVGTSTASPVAISFGSGLSDLTTGAITIEQSVISGNTSNTNGGAIFDYFGGALDISKTTFGSNSSASPGGVFNFRGNGTININECVFDKNSAFNGGGVMAPLLGSATINITNSSFTNNSTTGQGGVLIVFNTYNGTINISGSTFENNIAANSGGAIASSPAGGVVGGPNYFITNSTFVGNKAGAGGGGGAIMQTGAVVGAFNGQWKITNTTITGNDAAAGGGGVAFVKNALGAGAIIEIESSIIAENTVAGNAKSNFADIAQFNTGANGTVTVDFSLIGAQSPTPPYTNPTAGSNKTGTSAAPLSPVLSPIGLFGGTTRTRIPLTGSLAIGNGKADLVTVPNDQRGVGFPRDFNGSVDIGATEAFNPNPFVVSVDAQPITKAGGTEYQFTITFSDSQSNINTATLSTPGAVTVSGKGYPTGIAATFVKVDDPTPGKPRTATFKIPAPGGTWDNPDDDFGYIISIVGGKIFDQDSPTPNSVSSGAVATFAVGVPQTFIVNAKNDELTDTDGKLSLREAIAKANADPGNDLIQFDPAVFNAADTVTFTVPNAFNITDSVNIVGPAAAVVYDANLLSNLFSINGPGQLDVSIANLGMMNGLKTTTAAAFDGGAVFITDENVTLTNCKFVNNATQLSGGAVGQIGSGKLSVIDCLFENNRTDTGINSPGGAIAYGGSSEVFISGSKFSMNRSDGSGGAVSVIGASKVTIANCVFDQNQSVGSSAGGLVGGAVLVSGVPTVTITKTVFTQNQQSDFANSNAAGAIGIIGATTVTIDSCTFDLNSVANGDGGAVWTRADATGKLIITNSTFSNNSVAGLNGLGGAVLVNGNMEVLVSRSTFNNNTGINGGGLALDGTGATVNGSLTIENSTFSANTSNNDGAGLWVSMAKGAVVVRNSTFTQNTSVAGLFGGGGMAFVNQQAGSTITISSTVVAQNTAAPGQPRDIVADVPTTITADHTFVGVADIGNFTLVGTGNITGTDAVPADAKLGALANNGGLTMTHLPATNSPLLGAGAANGLLTDQRGGPRTIGANPDIGSVERALTAPLVTSVVINNGDAQRSKVTVVKVTFDQLVNISSLANAFTVERYGTKVLPAGAVALDIVQNGNEFTITFKNGGAVGVDPGNSLQDGQYKVTVVASEVSGDAGPMAANNVTNTWRLFGDGNGDGSVGAADFALFRSVFGTSPPNSPFDYNNDGPVNAADFAQFRGRFGLGGFNIP